MLMKKTLIFAASILLMGSITSCYAPPSTEESPTPIITKEETKTCPTPGQIFLKSKLAELDAILKTPEYAEYKWAIAGPYHQWPQKLKAEVDTRDDFSMYEKSGVYMLSNLAIEYAFANEYGIQTSRKHVEEVISTC